MQYEYANSKPHLKVWKEKIRHSKTLFLGVQTGKAFLERETYSIFPMIKFRDFERKRHLVCLLQINTVGVYEIPCGGHP